ncbi:hypothetical protein NDU88_007440 [Pleurodeles waltl]|uniref:Uncharacterized protein n=1 Tax=Pleurodeles waltl TaxID=8319 RepID=A0AAV7RT23_PLEWA|nr:hypothetical protein NDU88_007440 [Pleurodeles waltl]
MRDYNSHEPERINDAFWMRLADVRDTLQAALALTFSACQNQQALSIVPLSEPIQASSWDGNLLGCSARCRLWSSCVVGPHVEVSSVWIVGHLFVTGAAKQAELRPFGLQLGLDGSRVKIS